MALSTVADYVSEARRLLQDQNVPYRYPDTSIVLALNLAIGEASRIRAEMFQDYFDDDLPAYYADDLDEVVDVPPAFRIAFLYFIVGHNQLADQEDTTDARSTVLLNKFIAQLTSMPS
jgi:predicted phage-related endonuclease